jgi:hypothetical protein
MTRRSTSGPAVGVGAEKDHALGLELPGDLVDEGGDSLPVDHAVIVPLRAWLGQDGGASGLGSLGVGREGWRKSDGGGIILTNGTRTSPWRMLARRRGGRGVCLCRGAEERGMGEHWGTGIGRPHQARVWRLNRETGGLWCERPTRESRPLTFGPIRSTRFMDSGHPPPSDMFTGTWDQGN